MGKYLSHDIYPFLELSLTHHRMLWGIIYYTLEKIARFLYRFQESYIAYWEKIIVATSEVSGSSLRRPGFEFRVDTKQFNYLLRPLLCYGKLLVPWLSSREDITVLKYQVQRLCSLPKARRGQNNTNSMHRPMTRTRDVGVAASCEPTLYLQNPRTQRQFEF